MGQVINLKNSSITFGGKVPPDINDEIHFKLGIMLVDLWIIWVSLNVLADPKSTCWTSWKIYWEEESQTCFPVLYPKVERKFFQVSGYGDVYLHYELFQIIQDTLWQFSSEIACTSGVQWKKIKRSIGWFGEAIYLSKDLGGMGFKDIDLFN